MEPDLNSIGSGVTSFIKSSYGFGSTGSLSSYSGGEHSSFSSSRMHIRLRVMEFVLAGGCLIGLSKSRFGLGERFLNGLRSGLIIRIVGLSLFSGFMESGLKGLILIGLSLY